MENKIKVTVEYENPEMSKIDALIEQYTIAAKISKEKTTAIRSVIEEVGNAKFLAIGEQLKEIGAKLRQFCLAKGDRYNNYIETYYKETTRFRIKYDCDSDRLWYLYNVGTFSDGDSFFYEGNYKYLVRDDGLVTRWNKYDIINKLNEALEKKIISETKQQFENIRTAETHLNRMVN